MTESMNETLETVEAALNRALTNLLTLTGQYPGIDVNHYFCNAKNGIESALSRVATPNLDASQIAENAEDKALATSLHRVFND